jgi:hypothetical protein
VLSLGSLATAAWGDELPPRGANLLPPALARTAEPVAPSLSAVKLGRPVGVSLGRPVPAGPAVSDRALTPASYQPDATVPAEAANRPDPASAAESVREPAWPVPSRAVNDDAVSGGFATDGMLQAAPPVVPPSAVLPIAPDPATWGNELPAPPCGDRPGPTRFYVGGEYLLWWIKDSHTPPLVTTSPASSSGILGQPGTVVVLGGDLDNENCTGGRFTAGFGLPWFCKPTFLETNFLFLAERTNHFGAGSDQFPVLARPFFNLNAGTEFTQVTTSPGLAVGRIDVNNASRLWGGEVNVRREWCCGCWYNVDCLLGFRYLELNEKLEIVENLTVLPGVPTFAGSHVTVFDSFATRNQFYGGQVGASARLGAGRWTADLWTKFAMGDTHQVVNVVGNQVVTSPTGVVSNFTGGLLALNSNIGHFTRDQFAVVPEVGVNVGYQVTSRLRATLGYNFLYWSNVLRPGDQIDRVLDVTRIPNFPVSAVPAPQVRPVVPFKDTGFWAQGINVGLEWRY